MLNNINELFRIWLIKKIEGISSFKLKNRFKKLLYNYNSKKINGIDIIDNDYLPNRNLKFLLNTKEFIGWNILFNGEYESNTNNLLLKLVKQGDVIIEAGANNGSETILFGSIVGKKGKVYAFEPVPHIIKRLKINAILNDFDNIIDIVPNALGNKADDIKFYISDLTIANQGMSSKFNYALAKHFIYIKQITLDQFFSEKQLERFDFLKMDVQGGELDLLEGGLESIRKFKPIILTEAATEELKSAGKSIKDLWIKLNELGYNIFYCSGKTIERLSNENSLKPGNWLAVTELKSEEISKLYG